ncbi:hypothetical protein LX64_03200 [Chitinophaga skermanii]|uniref:SH3 domain-containing protein n=1 Tax=Chitinophaga skermanii TaxID=331697 RepID=A0A327QR93_9BACT|nr:hypothetical protein [Chitinophaga skermanii]RAJ04317.1 hypothetical protein LX64_03200 [Chitinophaga skermanii]
MRRVFPLAIVVMCAVACNNGTTTPTTDSAAIAAQHEADDRKTPILSERVAGSVNVYDGVNGKLLFTLQDDVPVTTTITENGWCQIGIHASLTNEEATNLFIAKGADIKINDQVAGKAESNLEVGSSDGELTGYIEAKYIKRGTIIENYLSNLLQSKGNNNITKQDLQPFIASYQLRETDVLGTNWKTYEYYDDWMTDASAGWRILLVFKGDNLLGVVHSRVMHVNDKIDTALELGYNFLNVNSTDTTALNDFVTQFNEFIVGVD